MTFDSPLLDPTPLDRAHGVMHDPLASGVI